MNTLVVKDISSSQHKTTRETQVRYHATVLSNFVLGYDKYSRRYDKRKIPCNRYPGQFYLLVKDDIKIGIDKSALLLDKLSIVGNKIVMMETEAGNIDLIENKRNGIGQYVERDWIKIKTIYYVEHNRLVPVSVEEAVADAYSLMSLSNKDYEKLTPRSVSILPVAKGCQAKCKFCFSESSISLEQNQQRLEVQRIEMVLSEAKLRGAERAVITGGGEPGILPGDELNQIISLCRREFERVIMISNGYFLIKSNDVQKKIIELDRQGLNVLSVSRHHFDRAENAKLMGLDIASEEIATAYQSVESELKNLSMRWICVLQKGGIEDSTLLREYIEWAASLGIQEICFKELYVSSSTESMYFTAEANKWSNDNQIGINLVTEYSKANSWKLVSELPWGSPIYEGSVNGTEMRIAAYTEPSLSWELQNGICRSWNLMANGNCYSSLETLSSEVFQVSQ